MTRQRKGNSATGKIRWICNRRLTTNRFSVSRRDECDCINCHHGHKSVHICPAITLNHRAHLLTEYRHRWVSSWLVFSFYILNLADYKVLVYRTAYTPDQLGSALSRLTHEKLTVESNFFSQSTTMGAAYTILGRSVQPHVLALATLGAVVFVAAPKPWGPPKPTHPAIGASSPEEEKFVKDFLAKHLEEKH